MEDERRTIRFDANELGLKTDPEPKPPSFSRFSLFGPILFALANTAIGIMLLKRGVHRDLFSVVLGILLIVTSVLSYWEAADYLAYRKDREQGYNDGDNDDA